MFDGPMYPDFLSGTAYLMTIDVAMKLYDAAFSIPVLHLEDVYLTGEFSQLLIPIPSISNSLFFAGFCASSVNVTPRNHQLFDFRVWDNLCELRGMLTKHQFTAKQLRDAYAFVNNSTAYCPPPEVYMVRDVQMCN